MSRNPRPEPIPLVERIYLLEREVTALEPLLEKGADVHEALIQLNKTLKAFIFLIKGFVLGDDNGLE